MPRIGTQGQDSRKRVDKVRRDELPDEQPEKEQGTFHAESHAREKRYGQQGLCGCKQNFVHLESTHGDGVFQEALDMP